MLENGGQSLHIKAIGLVYTYVYIYIGRVYPLIIIACMYILGMYLYTIYITICLSMKFDRTTIVGHLYIVMMVNTSTSEDLTGVCAAIYSFSPYPYNLHRRIIYYVYIQYNHAHCIYAV